MNLEACCRAYEARFAQAWPRLIREWQAEGADAFWLISHASYLFRTANVRWGVDLTLRTGAMLEEIAPRCAADLAPLFFVLTTHFHGDHFSPRLCEQLAGNDTRWILPDFMPPELREKALQAGVRTQFVRVGETLSLDGCRICVLSGHHYDDGGEHGVPACAYAVQTQERLLFFPGDVRDYRARPQPECVGADALFAHVWLGRSRAALPLSETFLENYCDYLAKAQAKDVYFTHLNDYSRKPEEVWTQRHAMAAARGLRARQPGVRTAIPVIGREQRL